MFVHWSGYCCSTWPLSQFASVVIVKSAIDETAHLPAGLSHFETGRIELYAVNPPLVRLLASLPVYAIGPNHDWSRHNSDISARAEFPVSKDFFRANGPTTLRYYVIARLALLPYHALGIIAVFLVGRRAFTSWFGVIAAGMWVLSPAMLGNGAMITPDSGASVAGVVFVYLLLTKSWVSCGGMSSYAALHQDTSFVRSSLGSSCCRSLCSCIVY
jgi:hypothetical protein